MPSHGASTQASWITDSVIVNKTVWQNMTGSQRGAWPAGLAGPMWR